MHTARTGTLSYILLELGWCSIICIMAWWILTTHQVGASTSAAGIIAAPLDTMQMQLIQPRPFGKGFAQVLAVCRPEAEGPAIFTLFESLQGNRAPTARRCRTSSPLPKRGRASQPCLTPALGLVVITVVPCHGATRGIPTAINLGNQFDGILAEDRAKAVYGTRLGCGNHGVAPQEARR